MSAPTPGPWEISGDRDDVWEIIAPTEAAVAPTFGSVAEITYTGGNAEANARLVTAAPDLLEALEALVETVAPAVSGTAHLEPYFVEPIAKARKALARARGES